MYPFSPEMASRLRFVKISDAARYYNINPKTVRNKIEKNLIAYIRIDKAYRIAVWADDYQKRLDEQKEEAQKAKNENNDK